jgi:hypothetical protein
MKYGVTSYVFSSDDLRKIFKYCMKTSRSCDVTGLPHTACAPYDANNGLHPAIEHFCEN